MKTKKGISLVTLVITLVVMAILAGIVILKVFDSTKEANMVAFREELNTILDESKSYYLQKGKLPIVEGVEYSKSDLLSIVPENSALIQEEIELNKDNSNKFYVLDLSLISDNVGIVGNTGTAGDFYVINEKGSEIYYPKGFKVRDTLYFSLSTKLDPSKQVIEDNSVTGNIQFVSNTSAIILTKSTDEWTDELTIGLFSAVSSGETVSYDILGDVVTETEDLDSTITISNVTLSDFQKETLKTRPIITAEKTNSDGEIIATTTLDISNLDCVAPELNEQPDVIAYDDYNLLKFSNVSDDKSGFKNIYYVQAEETEIVTASDVIANGKKVNVDYVRLYKHISNIKIVLEDSVGNTSEVINISVPEDVIKLYGDVNLDGEVSTQDIVSLEQYLLGEITYSGLQKALADVNLNGVVDEEDTDIIAKYIAVDPSVTELPVMDSVIREM